MKLNPERNKFFTGLTVGLPIAMFLWACIIAAVIWATPAKSSIGGGYIYFYDADQVVMGEWESFYVYPRMPHAVDYKVGDVVTITWKIFDKIDPETKKPVYIDHWTYTRSEADPEFSRYGEDWMLFGVFPGYVGTQPGTHLWEAKIERTGYTWPVLELIQVLPDKRPMPPTNLK